MIGDIHDCNSSSHCYCKDPNSANTGCRLEMAAEAAAQRNFDLGVAAAAAAA